MSVDDMLQKAQEQSTPVVYSFVRVPRGEGFRRFQTVSLNEF